MIRNDTTPCDRRTTAFATCASANDAKHGRWASSSCPAATLCPALSVLQMCAGVCDVTLSSVQLPMSSSPKLRRVQHSVFLKVSVNMYLLFLWVGALLYAYRFRFSHSLCMCLITLRVQDPSHAFVLTKRQQCICFNTTVQVPVHAMVRIKGLQCIAYFWMKFSSSLCASQMELEEDKGQAPTINDELSEDKQRKEWEEVIDELNRPFSLWLRMARELGSARCRLHSHKLLCRSSGKMSLDILFRETVLVLCFTSESLASTTPPAAPVIAPVSKVERLTDCKIRLCVFLAKHTLFMLLVQYAHCCTDL